jgi:hypothetical protein
MKAFPSAVLLAAGLIAQAQAPSQTTAHAPDGGVREMLQSILIPPLSGAPFQATVTTEWTKILPDGTMATMKNHRTVARDSAGRIFEERKAFTPNGDKEPTQTTNLQYLDPNRHEFYNCIPLQRTCYVTTDGRPALAKMPAGTGGLQVCGCASAPRPGMSVKQEALGEKAIGEIEAIGSREITTIAAGEIGNQKAEPIVKEFWYSPRLGVNLVTKRFDPRSGIQNFVVGNVSLSEPDPRMFEPPPEYRVVREVVERQGTAQAQP